MRIRFLRHILLGLALLQSGCGGSPSIVNSTDVDVELWVVPEEQVAQFFDQEGVFPKQPLYDQLRKTSNQYLVARVVSRKKSAIRGTLAVGENGREDWRLPPLYVYLPGDAKEALIAVPIKQVFWDFEETGPNLTFRWTELVWVN